jgi:hypothetical protein
MSLLALILLLLHPTTQDAVAPEWGRRLQWDLETGPPAREHAAFVVDPARDRAVMLTGSGYRPYGSPLGDAWSFDLKAETWTALELSGDALPAGGSQRAAPVDGGAYLFGGYGEGFADMGELWRLRWHDDQVEVTHVAQENPPPSRMLHAFACDPAGERFVVFGGVGGDDGLDDTWIGERTDAGVRWRQLEGGPGPGKRFGFSFAFDASRGRLLVCGGQVPPEGEVMEMIVARDLWALDVTADEPSWTRLAEYGDEVFPGRRNPAFSFDERTGDLFVWGGTGDGASALPGLYVVRTRVDGAPVERVPETDGISARASSFGVIDRRRGRALLGFGNTGAGPFDDLVEVRLRGAERGSEESTSDR